MTLQEIFDHLTHGELSQLSMGGGEIGQIQEENYPRVVSHINLGLTSLYRRFNLLEKRVLLELQTGITSYALTKKHAATNDSLEDAALTKWLLDSVNDPFADDILKVERVISDTGYDFPLNTPSIPYSVFTPSATTLRLGSDLVSGGEIPDYFNTLTMELVYRANHPKLVLPVGPYDPNLTFLLLPESHLEPLLYFVAARAHNPIGMTNEFHAGNSYSAKYEQACQGLEDAGLEVDQDDQNTKLQRNGWV